MKRLLALVLVLVAVRAASTQEIGYVEKFSLAKNREAALQHLIPGTDDYYYYHALHYLNTEKFDQVEAILKKWRRPNRIPPRYREIENRRAMLIYPRDNRQSLEFLRRKLRLKFNHQRVSVSRKSNLPTKLNPAVIDRDRLTRSRLGYSNNLASFEDRALERLMAGPLNVRQRRALLGRLRRPDQKQLVDLVAADLKERKSRGFGSLAIHGLMLRSQLDELSQKVPRLLNQTNFVRIYMTRLQPNADVDWRNDPAVHQAYLDRLWSFVTRLAPVHNSLKANVLYHRLVFDRGRGVYNKTRFMTYLKLPRNVSYVNPEYLKDLRTRQHIADLRSNYSSYTLHSIIGSDEPLVRDYFHHYFVKETTYKPYEPYVSDLYLKRRFAETKIVNGLGEGERWFSMLRPAEYKALKERVDLDFSPANKTLFGPDDPVQLDVNVKNVKSLIVKVYHIHARNYYQSKLAEVNSDINLEGLVANQVKTYQYDNLPLRRMRRTFKLPEISQPGTYVVDFVGNGKSTRALIRKGKLRYTMEVGPSGHVFKVLDDDNKLLKKSRILLSGHEYKSDKEGEITVPYSNRPGRQTIVLCAGDRCSLDSFSHQAEQYQLRAGIFVERATLLRHRESQLIVRPALYLNGYPITLTRLENVRLVIISTDHDGISTTKEIAKFKIHEDRESIHKFHTPSRLSTIQFQLRARVKSRSQNKTINLVAAQRFTLNQIDQTDKYEDLHFAKIGNRHFVDLLGKTGEPRGNRPVVFAFKHRDIRGTISTTLQTDPTGRIDLGALAGIHYFKATSPTGVSKQWSLTKDARRQARTVHVAENQPIRIPVMFSQDRPITSDLSLLELRGNTFFANQLVRASVKDGLLTIAGLRRGDYDLLMKESGLRIRIRVTKGEVRDGYVLGNYRHLELRAAKPLQIRTLRPDKKMVSIRLANHSPFTRVHVIATRYTPSFSSFNQLSTITDPDPGMSILPAFDSVYLAGRKVGDEYQYIIDRQYAKKYPGNMLNRPDMILNPFALRSTSTGKQAAKRGADPRSSRAPARRRSVGGNARGRGAASPADFANLDFLPVASKVITNLTPDKAGLIAIKRGDLGEYQQLHVIAIDPRSTVYRTIALKETGRSVIDLRLAKSLDLKKHFSQQKRVTQRKKGQALTLSDLGSSRLEVYDSLARVFTLYSTLTKDRKLLEFSFILNWDKLGPAEKKVKYSKFACHELNFFLYRRDSEFFDQIVAPHLKHKKDKTFMDKWLLGQDLKSYLLPWQYAQLNVVERILLAQRVKGESKYTSRHVRDLFELIPTNVDRREFLFQTAIKNSGLEDDDFGLKKERSIGLKKRVADFAKMANSPAGKSPQAAFANRGGRGGRGGGGFGGGAGEGSRGRIANSRESLSKKLDAVQKSPPRRAATKSKSRLGSAAALAKGSKRPGGFFRRDRASARAVRQLYQKLETTREWVENNYYKLPIEAQNGQLITVNPFWHDLANHDWKKPFSSEHIAVATRNLPEMMFALSLLELPYRAPKHDKKRTERRLTVTAGGPMIAFHEEIRETTGQLKGVPILVSQNFFKHGDRYKYVHGEKMDKYVSEEFIVHTVYGCQMVFTNPTSAKQKLEVLLQIPAGAIPVIKGHETRSLPLTLPAFHTKTLEYYFYFPIRGKYTHYPVQIAKSDKYVASAKPIVFNVVNIPTKIDRGSWAYVSQFGTNQEVLAFLNRENMNRHKLNRIAFRMRDKGFYRSALATLQRRHLFDSTLWSYGILHNDTGTIRQYLAHQTAFVRQCGNSLDCQLLVIHPVSRKTYQHKDYRPLVNARAHQLGRKRKILNGRLHGQYHQLLKSLSYHRELSDRDLMQVVYYMLLQDRIDDASQLFGQIDARSLATRMQYDYFASYLGFYGEDRAKSRQIAQRYADYPVARWRKAFREITAQLDEIDGRPTKLVDATQRNLVQTKLAATEPNLNLKVEARKIRIDYQNMKEVRVNYYLMDIELLFSRNPFVQQFARQFAYMKPNQTGVVKLPGKKSSLTIDLPKRFHNSNVLVEIQGSGQTKTQAYYSNSLAAQVIGNYGQIRVTRAQTRRSIPKVYVKVYARMKNGVVKFYKDGYTDLRGRFDYSSLSTNDLANVDRFAILVLSKKHGAVVQETTPPKQ